MSDTPCPDCRVAPGEEHVDGCDVARCLHCGCQRLSCGCKEPGRDVWTGEWPMVAEAREHGWYSKFVALKGWVECNANDPGASPDLYRVMSELVWDRISKRWIDRPRPLRERS